MKINFITPEILHLRFATQKDAAMAMVRIDQFSEGSKDFLGKYFTLEDFKVEWSRMLNKLGFDYFNYYEGWNISGPTMDKWLNLFGHDVNEWEIVVIESLGERLKTPYLIVDFEGCGEDVLEHEICHAKYSLDSEYRKRMTRVLNSIPNHYRLKAYKDLIKSGYPGNPGILDDEIHAYWMTSLNEELIETFPQVPLELILKFKEKFNKTDTI